MRDEPSEPAAMGRVVPFPARGLRGEDRLARAIASLQLALGEQARAVASWRDALGELGQALGGLEGSLGDYRASLDALAVGMETLHGQARELEAIALD